ncbi:hydroxyethylthiazole kinase [Geminicoccaceae bacterium 1502E]|nr:hydroxyethylthiazole kinase [Geminicoccaceae bacterium 1502E]
MSACSRPDWLETVATPLTRLRAERPRVHVLTNFVAMNVSANVLLALGAVPSMTFRADTVADFVRSARALVVNLGMLDPEREAAIGQAVPAASVLGLPWVLDPVKVERSGPRRDLALRLLRMRPAVLRANAAEVETLAGLKGREGAERLAREFDCVVALTGATDIVTDGEQTVQLAGGSPLMDRVTAMGCAASAVVGAFLAVERDAFGAALAALASFAAAGGIAAGRARGPGSFEPELLDALFALEPGQIMEKVEFR